MPHARLFGFVTISLLSACTPADEVQGDDPRAGARPPAQGDTQVLQSENGIETLATGACVARTAPRETTTVISETVEVAPAVVAPDGQVISEAVFRNQTRPVVEVLDAGTRFETLCPFEITPERVMTLQRALQARLVYQGPVTGGCDLLLARFRNQIPFDEALRGRLRGTIDRCDHKTFVSRKRELLGQIRCDL